ncbi:hypothetical protein N1851_005172 [Merluccius polli]|uniref:THAP-type domain-containing protein n=1 Tax=Merluccius polli TaxID=89951 RepID=A0AA47N7C0_MERPO|nr:hypothetical protein N1851_005172 [Merluccius polli]
MLEGTPLRVQLCVIVDTVAAKPNVVETIRTVGYNFLGRSPFRFPKWRKHLGEQVSDITRRRRISWVAAIRRKDLTFDHIPQSMRVCSLHFHSGKPSYEMLENHPDWTPSLRLGHSEVKTTDEARYQRQHDPAPGASATAGRASGAAAAIRGIGAAAAIPGTGPAASIPWPSRECLLSSMPHQFVESFGKNVAAIVDCFEVFIEKPSNELARAQTFSQYKHAYTMKYLIVITPQGVISFISEGWGGRTSDKHITEQSGFLNKLLPGDIVLADRGFNIRESVGMMCAEVKVPTFTRGHAQLDAKDVEETRAIAHLRIHVERVIGVVRNKFILHSTVPVNMLIKGEGENLMPIVTVCCALTNMCKSVV